MFRRRGILPHEAAKMPIQVQMFLLETLKEEDDNTSADGKTVFFENDAQYQQWLANRR